MAEAHSMIVGVLSKQGLTEFVNDPELTAMIFRDYSADPDLSVVLPQIDEVLELKSVKALVEKAKKQEHISVAEWDNCLRDITQRSHYLGYVLKAGEEELKPLLRALPRGEAAHRA